MTVEQDLETNEEKRYTSKKLSGKNMYLKSKRCENFTEDMEKTDEHSKSS
jgi:hypothetical protein